MLFIECYLKLPTPAGGVDYLAQKSYKNVVVVNIISIYKCI